MTNKRPLFFVSKLFSAAMLLAGCGSFSFVTDSCRAQTVELERSRPTTKRKSLDWLFIGEHKLNALPMAQERPALFCGPIRRSDAKVTLKIGNRVVERIDANQLNMESAEKAGIFGKSIPR